MPAIPSIASFTAPSVTEGDFKTALSNLHLFLTGLLGTDGTQAGGQAALGALLGAGSATKTTAYTVTSADRGKVIACSGTFTVTLPDAAVVGSGFAVAIGNYGAGTITVDPFSAQTIDGATTRAVAANTMIIACAVAGEWLSVGGAVAASTSNAGVVQLIDSISSTSITMAPTANACKFAYDGAVSAYALASSAFSNAESRVSKDNGHGNVGSLCFAKVISGGAFVVNPGDGVDGGQLRASSADSEGFSGAPLVGSWRCLGFASNQYPITLFQRVA